MSEKWPAKVVSFTSYSTVSLACIRDLSESCTRRSTSIKHKFLYLYMCLQKTVSGCRISLSIS